MNNNVFVLKNYSEIKGRNVDEFPAIKIKYDEEDVFTFQPICQVPYGNRIEDAYLMLDSQKNLTAVSKEHLLKVLELTKVFFLKVDKTSVHEVEKGQHDLWVRLPKNTDVSELGYLNNQIVKIDKEKSRPASKKEVTN